MLCSAARVGEGSASNDTPPSGVGDIAAPLVRDGLDDHLVVARGPECDRGAAEAALCVTSRDAVDGQLGLEHHLAVQGAVLRDVHTVALVGVTLGVQRPREARSELRVQHRGAGRARRGHGTSAARRKFVARAVGGTLKQERCDRDTDDCEQTDDVHE